VAASREEERERQQVLPERGAFLPEFSVQDVEPDLSDVALAGERIGCGFGQRRSITDAADGKPGSGLLLFNKGSSAADSLQNDFCRAGPN
jgi:hypothetical protein